MGLIDWRASVGRGVYEQAGIDYDVLDASKRSAITEAAATSALLGVRGGDALDASRGEPAFVFRLGTVTLALVQECLGTKSVLARHFEESTGESRWSAIGIDAVAAIVNDLICVGASPLVVNAYFATGGGHWLDDPDRQTALARGWREGCELAGAVWGGGESPSLPGLVAADDIELAGCGIGQVPAGIDPLLGDQLTPGDEIVLLASSGLHTNGASLVRRMASELPDGLTTALPSGASIGDAALTPTLIYVKLVEALLAEGAPVHYLSHVTGHGLRKIMRPQRELTYRIRALPETPELLQAMADHFDMGPGEAYGTLNMGVGFAIYCEAGAGDQIVTTATSLGFDALVGGEVEAGARRVVIDPLDISYQGTDLQLH